MSYRSRLFCGLAGAAYLALALLLFPSIRHHSFGGPLPPPRLLVWGFLLAMGGCALAVAFLARRVL